MATITVNAAGGADHTTIQAAIDAAGAIGVGPHVITVAAGVYVEQIDISGFDDIDIQGAPGAIIRAPATLASFAVDPITQEDIYAVVTVRDDFLPSVGATLSGFVIDGDGRGDEVPGSGEFVGVAFVDATGSLSNSDVIGVRHPTLNGVQSGTGVLVTDIEFDIEPDFVVIADNNIQDVQKNGVTIRQVFAEIEDNTITGAGATAVIAQNGLQISDFATAEITGNTITDFGYTGVADVVATGLLVIDSAGPGLIGENAITGVSASKSVGVALVDSEDQTITGNIFSTLDTAVQEDITFPPFDLDYIPNVLTGAQGDNSFNAIADQNYDLLVDASISDNVIRTGTDGVDVMDGGAGDDDFTGADGADVLIGNDGEDTLDGGDGDDFLKGGAEDDTLIGGGEFDTAIYDGPRANYTVVEILDVDGRTIGFQSVTETAVIGDDEGTDALSGIEALLFSDVTLTIDPPLTVGSVTATVSIDGEQTGTGVIDTLQAGFDNDLEVGGGDTTGLLFQNVAIPVGATITSATIELTSQRQQSGNSSIAVKLLNDGSIAGLAGAGVLTQPGFNAYGTTNWSVTGALANGQSISTPELATLVQQLVDDDPQGDGTFDLLFALSGAGAIRRFIPEEFGAASAAKLTIDFEVEGPGDPNAAPVIVSPTAFTIDENQTAVGTVAATDADGPNPLSYGIAGGADASQFSIDATTGALSFTAAPDFENPGDAGANNVYDLVVSAFDGVDTTTQTVTVTVEDVDESIDPDLVFFNGKFYKLGTQGLSWTQAQAEALAAGGYLVVVNDLAENQFVVNTFGEPGKPIWVGLSDAAVEGQFVTASGESSAFRNWIPGQPDASSPAADYAAIADGQGRWDDTGNLGGWFRGADNKWVNVGTAQNLAVIEFDSLPGPANTPPTANPDAAVIAEDSSPSAIDVLANDSDSDGFIVDVTAASNPPNGTATVNPDNTISYTPDADFFGEDVFTYTIVDDDGATAQGVVTVTVTGVNDDDPTAVDDEIDDVPGTSLLIDVLANDFDVDDPAEELTIVSATQGSQGEVQIAGNQILYLRDTAIPGPFAGDTFTYTIEDTTGQEDVATVTILPESAGTELVVIAGGVSRQGVPLTFDVRADGASLGVQTVATPVSSIGQWNISEYERFEFTVADSDLDEVVIDFDDPAGTDLYVQGVEVDGQFFSSFNDAVFLPDAGGQQQRIWIPAAGELVFDLA